MRVLGTKLLIQSVVFFKIPCSVPSLMYKVAISLIYALWIPHKYKAFENIIELFLQGSLFGTRSYHIAQARLLTHSLALRVLKAVLSLCVRISAHTCTHRPAPGPRLAACKLQPLVLCRNACCGHSATTASFLGGCCDLNWGLPVCTARALKCWATFPDPVTWHFQP